MLYGEPAPSEKHLEDWIVNKPHLFAWLTAKTEEWIPIADTIIARQCSLPTGIPDLIVRI